MLSRLHIRNYVLIDSLDISFPGGLIIITGRTGAGKSILLGALNLVLGGKAGPEMIGSHGDGCVVEADFELRSDSPFKAFFEENDLEWNDGQITIRRTVSAAGRSRSFIGDLPVPVGVLSEIAADLVDIHSQQQTRILTDAAYQLEVLDRYAGCSADTPGPLEAPWCAQEGLCGPSRADVAAAGGVGIQRCPAGASQRRPARRG